MTPYVIQSHRRAWEWLCNCALGALYLLFACSMLSDFRHTYRLSSLLLALFETVVVVITFSRPMPKQSNVSVYDWSVALGGTLICVLLRPAAEVHDHVPILAAQLTGMCVSLAGLLSLNRSFGIVAANRGIKTEGLYRIVRHPIYAGYFVSVGAFAIQNRTLANWAIYGLFLVLQILRVDAEERLLIRDAGYRSYSHRIRWRLLPFVY